MDGPNNLSFEGPPAGPTASLDPEPPGKTDGNAFSGSQTDGIRTLEKNEFTANSLDIIAVLFKETSLDSPSFRSSVNHLNTQFEAVDRWLDSFVKSTQKISQEMEGS